jgi:hypothetical protein
MAAPHQTGTFPSDISIKPGPRMKAALILAIVADLIQLIIFPIFITGVESPADDMLDVCVAGLLGYLLGWHWEFLPSFLVKLVPGVDLVPLWTLAVANVYRKSRPQTVKFEPGPGPSSEKSPRSS